VFVHGSGAENGLNIGGNDIAGTASFINNTAVGASQKSKFGFFENTVGRNLVIVGNDATLAYEPMFVGSNVVGGNLVCFGNVPDLTNDPPGGPFPNAVDGRRLGQCADL
jgi:hypothetical protein